jgi:hypothetical protein
MPPKRNQLPPPVEPDLPPLNEFDAPTVPGEEPIYAEELYGDAGSVPADVAADVAAMEIPSTGMAFDFSSLNVQTKEDFQALPEEQKELLRAMKRGVQFTPQSAAEFILSQTNARLQTEQQIKRRQADPAVQKSVEKSDLDIAEKKKEAAQKRQSAMDEINSMRGTISGLLTHPGFSGSVGMKNQSYLFGLKTAPVAGTKEADFQAMLEQVQGAAFLQAFERLKGGGQITQIEGEKATQAIIRAQQSQSEDGFKKSMQEALELLNRAEKRVMSGETVGEPAGATAPASRPMPQFTVGQRVTDRFGNVAVYRGMDGAGKPILDPVR